MQSCEHVRSPSGVGSSDSMLGRAGRGRRRWSLRDGRDTGQAGVVRSRPPLLSAQEKTSLSLPLFVPLSYLGRRANSTASDCRLFCPFCNKTHVWAEDAVFPTASLCLWAPPALWLCGRTPGQLWCPRVSFPLMSLREGAVHCPLAAPARSISFSLAFG